MNTSPILIAGPCSAETEEQVMTTATALARQGITIFRAGIWKPRTRPGSFEGVGVKGFPWLQRVRHELGMEVVVEVGTPHHVEEALRANVTYWPVFPRRYDLCQLSNTHPFNS